MTTLSLNGHDREALSLIEAELSGTDPRLAAKLGAFARLSDGEAMPERERIPVRGRSAIGRALLPRRGARLCWLPLAVWLLVSLTLLSVALLLSQSGGRAACPGLKVSPCSARTAPSGHRPVAGVTGG